MIEVQLAYEGLSAEGGEPFTTANKCSGVGPLHRLRRRPRASYLRHLKAANLRPVRIPVGSPLISGDLPARCRFHESRAIFSSDGEKDAICSCSLTPGGGAVTVLGLSPLPHPLHGHSPAYSYLSFLLFFPWLSVYKFSKYIIPFQDFSLRKFLILT